MFYINPVTKVFQDENGRYLEARFNLKSSENYQFKIVDSEQVGALKVQFYLLDKTTLVYEQTDIQYSENCYQLTIDKYDENILKYVDYPDVKLFIKIFNSDDDEIASDLCYINPQIADANLGIDSTNVYGIAKRVVDNSGDGQTVDAYTKTESDARYAQKHELPTDWRLLPDTQGQKGQTITVNDSGYPEWVSSDKMTRFESYQNYIQFTPENGKIYIRDAESASNLDFYINDLQLEQFDFVQFEIHLQLPYVPGGLTFSFANGEVKWLTEYTVDSTGYYVFVFRVLMDGSFQYRITGNLAYKIEG